MSLDTIGGFGGNGSNKRYLHLLVDHFSRYASDGEGEGESKAEAEADASWLYKPLRRISRELKKYNLFFFRFTYLFNIVSFNKNKGEDCEMIFHLFNLLQL